DKTQLHLDRCLTCRNCETTCPSGVEFHTLLDIGRAAIEQQVERPARQRLLAGALRQVVPNRAVFGALLRTGRMVRSILPEPVRQHIPVTPPTAKARPPARHARRVLMLEGCVQPSLSPNTN